MNIIRKIYLYKIFDNFMLLYPLYSVMFVERGHLDTLHISTLFVIWSVTGLLLEVPTGVLADRYSRRSLLALGELIRGVGYALWLVWPTYAGFALGFILWGIGGALDSGTFQALVYDELKAQDKERSYAKVIGRTESMSMLVGIIATLAAAPVLKQFGYGGILGGSVAATLIAAWVARTLPDQKRQENVEVESYARILKSAAQEVARNTRILQIIGFGILLATFFGVMDEYASLFLHDAGVKDYLIPLASAAMFLPSIVAGLYAHTFEKLQSSTFIWMVVGAGAALFAAGKFLGIAGIVGFAAFLLLTKVAEIVYGAKLQHGIAGHTRSTITSINALGVELAAILAYLAYGMATRIGGTAGALESFGLVMAGLGAVLVIFVRGKLPFKTSRSR